MAQDSSLLPFKVAPSSDLADVTMWSERAEWNGTGPGGMVGWMDDGHGGHAALAY